MEHKLNAPFDQSNSQQENSYCIHADSVPEATKLFERAKHNLLHINKWNEISGADNTVFQLLDQYGKKANRSPIKGDYIRIERVLANDEKVYDWVKVEEIVEQAITAYHISIALKVTPVNTPSELVAEKQPDQIDSVFSLFTIERFGSFVYASVYGAPKKNQFYPNFLNRIFQSFERVASNLGLVKDQWKLLAKGMLSF